MAHEVERAFAFTPAAIIRRGVGVAALVQGDPLQSGLLPRRVGSALDLVRERVVAAWCRRSASALAPDSSGTRPEVAQDAAIGTRRRPACDFSSIAPSRCPSRAPPGSHRRRGRRPRPAAPVARPAADPRTSPSPRSPGLSSGRRRSAPRPRPVRRSARGVPGRRAAPKPVHGLTASSPRLSARRIDRPQREEGHLNRGGAQPSGEQPIDEVL